MVNIVSYRLMPRSLGTGHPDRTGSATPGLSSPPGLVNRSSSGPPASPPLRGGCPWGGSKTAWATSNFNRIFTVRFFALRGSF